MGYCLWEKQGQTYVCTSVNEVFKTLLGKAFDTRYNLEDIIAFYSSKSPEGKVKTANGIITVPMKVVRVSPTSFVMQVAIKR